MSLMSPSTRTLSSLRHLTTKKLPLKKPFSTGTNRIPLPRTPHPHQYELILSHPTFPNPAGKTTTTRRSTFSDSEPSFEDWVDKKLAHPSKNVHVPGMDKKKREYYNQRRKALYGEDSDDEREKRVKKGEFVELVPEVVEFKSLHEKEEELYFYDAIIVPWEKDKHYRMVYQLENKFFPGQGMDNAFLPGEKWGTNANRKAKPKAKDNAIAIDKHEDKDKDKDKDKEKKDDNLVFFGEKDKEGMRVDLSLKKVGEFFKGLRKKYNITNNINKKDLKAVEGLDEGLGLDEPFLATRTTGLPVTWDSPGGTVVLVNKPKGWTSFTVCGKLRRLTNVRKVGHAGTLDPMATGLLIVCVGRATKIVDSYQGMVKGYSGTFRLGEATSTWDADSPVIQREPWEHVKDSDIKKAVASFRGEIWQVPPMFSAIKVGGEKMYDKARRGESIELSPRRISILKFDVERSLEDRQNLIFRVTCSKGTYIRSLCADLGKALGSCAHLTALRRDSIGDYSADDAFNFEELETLVTKKYV